MISVCSPVLLTCVPDGKDEMAVDSAIDSDHAMSVRDDRPAVSSARRAFDLHKLQADGVIRVRCL